MATAHTLSVSSNSPLHSDSFNNQDSTLLEHSPDLIPGTVGLINEIEQRLRAGESFNNPKLTELANSCYGGTRLEGVFTSKDAYDALEAAVNRKLLAGEARALMEMAEPHLGLAYVLRPLLQQLPRQTDRTTEQDLLQQYSTPPTLSYVAARVLNPRPTDIVIEPSAGTASLAIWARAVGAEVITNEISPRRRALLEFLGFTTCAVDAEFLDDLLPSEIKPTAFITNPPFSATGGRVANNNTMFGARHIETDLRRLEQGGRLVGYVGQGMGLDKPTFSRWWRQIAESYTVRANFSLPGDEYSKYGTYLISNFPSNFPLNLSYDKLRALQIRTAEDAKHNVFTGSL